MIEEEATNRGDKFLQANPIPKTFFRPAERLREPALVAQKYGCVDRFLRPTGELVAKYQVVDSGAGRQFCLHASLRNPAAFIHRAGSVSVLPHRESWFAQDIHFDIAII